ncbi:MAG: lyase [Gammaproteobacteria bacterium]
MLLRPLLALLSLVLLLPAAPAAPAAELELASWTVPWPDSRPRDPAVAADGVVWFVGQKGDYLGRFDPASADFSRIDLGAGAGPHNVIVDGAGQIWIAGNRQAWIGRYDAASAEIERFPTPQPHGGDPHTLAATDGAIWFTSQRGNHIGRLDPGDGSVELVAAPRPAANPYGLVTGADGSAWVALFGTNALGHIDATTLELELIPLPREDARPRRVALGSNGDVWYVDYLDGYLGRYRPADGSIVEWPVPGGAEAGPYGMTIDAADRLWFVETGSTPNQLIVFNSRQQKVIAARVIEAGAVRHMVYDARSDAVWFGTDHGELVQARLR